MALKQMEFDFDPPKKRPVDTPVLMKVELTKGWDGETIQGLYIHGTHSDACHIIRNFVQSNPREYGPYRDMWTCTSRNEPVKHTVCDYGSHVYFGRITRHEDCEQPRTTSIRLDHALVIIVILLLIFSSKITGCATHIVDVWHGRDTTEVEK